ncbi:hypothetical protein G3A_03085 [Bacillus sp. 17376]|nr:hypothetical protein G3A_03085 [Bacillus sp. 17376]
MIERLSAFFGRLLPFFGRLIRKLLNATLKTAKKPGSSLIPVRIFLKIS